MKHNPYWNYLLLFLVSLFLSMPDGAIADSDGAKSGVAPTTLVLPSGPGSLGGIGENVRANLNMGLMSYRIRVILPKGRRGIDPSLDLTYSSSAGSGIAGIGWSFSGGSSISRLTVRGLPKYDNTDRFYSDTGEVVAIPNTVFFRSRIEGAFVRYRWHRKNKDDQRGYWTAEFPNGEIGYYGADEKGNVDLNSQVYGAQGTYAWKLHVRVDRNGNRIVYRYLRKDTQLYLERMEWVFSKAGKPLYLVEFSYEDRPDPISDGKPGFDLLTTQRLSKIAVYTEGKRLRSYHLKFEKDSGLSRLVQVTRYGRDPDKAHPLQFTMKYSNSTFSAQNSMMIKLPTSVGQNFGARNSDFIDINGDGLPDVVNTTSAKHQFHINQLTLDKTLKQSGHDFPTNAVKENPQSINAQLSNPSVQLLDINGDGYSDLVDAANKSIYLNKGNGKWEDNSQSLQAFPVTGKDPNMRFFDYNGDKAIDVIRADSSGTTYWVSDKKGSWNVAKGGTDLGVSFSKDKVRLIDMNGDGLMDAVQIFGGKLRYRKYFGYGRWSSWVTVEVPGLGNVDPSFVDRAQFSDMNGDGLADMVAFLGTSIQYFVNQNGIKFSPGQSLKAFQGIDIPDSTKTSIRLADLNGNGSRDIVWIDSSGKITYLELFGLRPNLMQEISNGLGQRIEITYGSSVYHRLRDEAAGKPWSSKLPMPFLVVNQIKTWAERDGKSQPRPHIQQILYHDGFYDGKEKKFRGFRRVETLFLGDDSATTRREEHFYNVGETDTYFHGKLLRRTVTDDKAKIYHKDTVDWQDCGVPAGAAPKLDPPVRYICRKSHEKVAIEGLKETPKWVTTRIEWAYDGFGQVTLRSELGVKDKPGDERYTRTAYNTPKDPKAEDSLWIINRMQSRQTCPALAGPCSEIRAFYDGEALKGLPLGQMTKGNLMRSIGKRLADKDEWLPIQRFQRDQYGNAIVRMTPRGMRRTTAWDKVYQRFPVSETTHVSKDVQLTASTLWDYGLNAVIQSTDYNGHKTYYSYDHLGRIKTMALPGDSPGTPSIRYIYELGSPLNRIIKERRSKIGGPWDMREIKCYDGLGRMISKRALVAPGKYLVSGHIEHNSMDQAAVLWDIYTSDEPCSFLPPKDTPKSQRFYDGQKRLTKILHPDGAFRSFVYEPLKQTNFDENDNDPTSPHHNTPTITLFDGLSRAIEERQMSSAGKTRTTKYTYTSHNLRGHHLIKTLTLPNGDVKTHTYDLFGNTLSVVDPDRATILYEYNADHLVTRRIDARGATIAFTYDVLGRALTVQELGKDQTRISYTYDQVQRSFPDATNVKGRLSKVQFPIGSEEFSYDRRGRQSSIQRKIMGVTYLVKMRYNQVGWLLEKTFPDGRKLNYQYDPLGRQKAIPGFISSISYKDNGLIDQWKTAKGLATTHTFDQRKRLKKLEVGDVMSLGYTYDAAGNILNTQERHGTQEWRHGYQYDALYRLTRASLRDDQEILSYKHDQLDNITEKRSNLKEQSPAHIGAYAYDEAKPHAVKQAGPFKIEYDKAGYTRKRGELRYQWDYMGRCTQVENGTEGRARFWYGSSWQRLLKEENGMWSWYVQKDYHVRPDGAIIYIHLGRNRVVAWKRHAANVATAHFDDLAPAEGTEKLKAKPDGKITVADAWLYHASHTKQLAIDRKKRPFEVNLLRNMMTSSLQEMMQEKAESTHYWHADQVGSIRAVTDSEGQVLDRKHFYPFGQLMPSEAQKMTETRTFSFGFMGTERDVVANTNYFGARSMDTKLGRWVSPDPLFDRSKDLNDEWNSYGVVLNNPISKRDISGFATADANDATSWLHSKQATYVLAGAAAAMIVGPQIINFFSRVFSKLLFRKKINTFSTGHIASLTGMAVSTAMLAASLKLGQSKNPSDRRMANTMMMLSVATSIASGLMSLGVTKSRFKGVMKASEKKKLYATFAVSTTVKVGVAIAAASGVSDKTRMVLGAVSGAVAVLGGLLSMRTKAPFKGRKQKAKNSALAKKRMKATRK